MGIRHSQTRLPKRLASLLLIGVLLSYALWLIGLIAHSSGYRVQYGSKRKAGQTLSILSLALQWMLDVEDSTMTDDQFLDAITELANLVRLY